MAYIEGPDIYAQDRQMRLSEKLGDQTVAAGQQTMQVKDQKMKQAEALRLVSIVTPDNYSSIVQEAESKGLLPPGAAPPAYDANWISQAKSSLGGTSKRDGGSTGVLVERYMESTGATFPQALQAVQTGFRQNMLLGSDGSLSNILGSPQAKEEMKYYETSGGNKSDSEYKPTIERNSAAQKEIGRNQGEKQVLLGNLDAALPQLETATANLSELGKKATYTLPGQGKDFVFRQTGMGETEGAVAREEYSKNVDSIILPLLRETFGAAFTVKEGDLLRSILGDVDKGPKAKDAALRAFIANKKLLVETLKSTVGKEADGMAPVTVPPKDDMTPPDIGGTQRRWKVVQ